MGDLFHSEVEEIACIGGQYGSLSFTTAAPQMTYAPDPKKNEFKLPDWAPGVAYTLMVLTYATLRLWVFPAFDQANQSGASAAADVCQKIEGGMSINNAVISIMDRDDYPKQLEFVTMNKFKSDLKECNAFMQQAEANIFQ